MSVCVKIVIKIEIDFFFNRDIYSGSISHSPSEDPIESAPFIIFILLLLLTLY